MAAQGRAPDGRVRYGKTNTKTTVTTPKPNLFLVGAMKSATTYLSDLLREHPAIFMSSPKEPCHFVDGRVLRKAWPHMWGLGYWRSVDQYLGLFARAGDAKVIGEASTTYSQAPMFSGVPQRILELSPEARFIYVMRDPVERTISHYWHRVRYWGERRWLDTAIRVDPQYVDTSHYAMQLAVYLRHASRERIYVVTYEALLADSGRQLQDIYAWLGVDPAFRPRSLDIPTNVMPTVVEQVRGGGVLDRFRRSRLYGTFDQHVPRAIRRLGSQLAVRRVIPSEVPVKAIKDYLRSVQREQVSELCRLLNRTFPEWRTFHDTENSVGAITAQWAEQSFR
jgi:hypothetical protein